VAHVERAFRSAAAYGCQPAEAGHFWALYGLLTQQERSACTGRAGPGVCDQLQRQLRETEEVIASRFGALLKDRLSWAKAQSTTTAPAPPRPDQRCPDPESRQATPHSRSGHRCAATAAAAAAAAAVAVAAAAAVARDNVIYNCTGNRDHDATETARWRKQGLSFKCVSGGPIPLFDCLLHPPRRGKRQPRALRAPQCFAYPPA
jgi:hypothetical protein